MRSIQSVLIAFIAAAVIESSAFAAAPAVITTADTIATGKQPHKRVLALTTATFHTAIQDEANPLWLLKFYAPWCGHCKRMAPVLDKVAPELEGKMAIGKIDCTQEKSLCDKFSVRGYPTMKVSLDGAISDYTGGRKAQDFISFADKMNLPAVQSVASMQAATEQAISNGEAGVAFVVYHGQAAGDTMEKKMQSTLLTQIVAQVARKQQAYATFLLLETTEDAAKEPSFCRIEEHVEPRCFENVSDVTTEALFKFVQTENVPTVSHLGPNNFQKIGRSGRPLVIGVVDGDNADQVADMKQRLIDFAVSGDDDLRDKYYYGWFDGKLWQKFLAQFDVLPEESPQVFCLNVPKKTYWQNATYKMNVDDFLNAIKDGTIEKQSAGKQGLEGVIEKLKYAVVENQPWSIIVLVLLGLTVAVFIASVASPGEPLRPPKWKEDAERADAVAKKRAAEAKDKAAQEKSEGKKQK